jgi:hypothetical protein
MHSRSHARTPALMGIIAYEAILILGFGICCYGQCTAPSLFWMSYSSHPAPWHPPVPMPHPQPLCVQQQAATAQQLPPAAGAAALPPAVPVALPSPPQLSLALLPLLLLRATPAADLLALLATPAMAPIWSNLSLLLLLLHPHLCCLLRKSCRLAGGPNLQMLERRWAGMPWLLLLLLLLPQPVAEGGRVEGQGSASWV